jgi:molybdopterin-guanine dinucleotide biosynthesis protein A
MTRNFSIAVLAGGRSARMGRDKALIGLEPDGRPMLGVVLDLVSPLSDDIFVVGNRKDVYARFGFPVLPDLYLNAAVLGGIGSAISHARHDACLVLSCDQPFVNRKLIRAMAEATGEWNLLVPELRGVSRQGGHHIRQTLHAMYTKACLSAIERAIMEGRLQTISFHDEIRVNSMEESVVKQFDPELRAFFNVNTPAALATANAWRTASRAG